MNWLAVTAFGVGVWAVVNDLARRSIPNWLTGAGIAAGLISHLWAGGWRGLGLAAAGGGIGFVLPLPLFVFGAMGGGDVKLMAAFGTMLGPAGILLAALLGAAVGGLEAVAWLAVAPRSRAVPYAPPIVLGVWLSLLGGGL